MHDIIVDRRQENIITDSLRHIDCHYLAFQIDAFFNR